MRHNRESFDPEVILTCDWLHSSYGVDLNAFTIELLTTNDQTFVNVQQRFPLKELDDAYEPRKRVAKKAAGNGVEWDEVLPTLEYSFAKRALDMCRRFREGDPSRRRFSSLRKHYDGLDWITINFRRKYLNVYFKGKLEDAQTFFDSKFPGGAKLGEWRDGYNIRIDSEEEFEQLVAWLRLDQPPR